MEIVKTWSGGECPEDKDSRIKPYYRGSEKPHGIRILCAPAGRLNWSHDGGDDDIVSYVVQYDAKAGG